MKQTLMIQDLFDHNDWANRNLMSRCQQLSDQQLDQPREMGLGSLRNTLFHILEAEALWLERWQGKPWRALAAESVGISVADIVVQAAEIAALRNRMIEAEAHSDFKRVVDFKNSQQIHSSFPIGDLMLHVCNHGIHHRAQVLNFLKVSQQEIPQGVDYILWKLARPSCEQPAESVEAFQDMGLEIATRPGSGPKFDKSTIRRYFQYNDWAMHCVMKAAAETEDAKLDREFVMGLRTLRKTFQHLIDAERWWQSNWRQDNSPFPQGERDRSLTDLTKLYVETAEQRNEFLEALNDSDANQILSVFPRGLEIRIRVTESLLQLCGHGTHHRAQALNMLRHLGIKPPAIDLIVWLRVSSV